MYGMKKNFNSDITDFLTGLIESVILIVLLKMTTAVDMLSCTHMYKRAEHDLVFGRGPSRSY